MPYPTRLAQPADLDGVLQLAEGKVYASWPSQECANRKEAALDLLRSLGGSDRWVDYDLLVAGDPLEGFLLLKKRFIRDVNGDCESVIEDCFAPEVAARRSLLQAAAAAARGHEAGFLTMEIAPQEGGEFLGELGFQVESHKISVPTADCRAPEGSPYAVRPPVPGDDFSIAVLNSTVLSHTLCASREYDLSDLTFRTMNAIFQQLNSPQCAALVLTLGAESVGHLLLQLNDRFGYIYDLAVAPQHWGGKAVLHIMRAGSQLLFQRNIPLMVGDVSASNLRALKIARRYLGFTVDFERYVQRL